MTAGTEKEIRFGPGRYEISERARKPGQFTAMMTLGFDAYEVQRGRLEIIRFDRTGIAGLATFTANLIGPRRSPPAKTVEVRVRCA